MPDPFTNAFIGKPEEPTHHELAGALGKTKPLWDQLLADLAQEFQIDLREWHSYSRKAGWAMRLKQAKRTILYLSPGRGSFRASFALGDKALTAARQNGLPVRVVKMINEAKRYAEGTPVRIAVKNRKDVAVVKKLAAAKLQNRI
jgi:hypothetical protein